jgi:hypothetical protein
MGGWLDRTARPAHACDISTAAILLSSAAVAGVVSGGVTYLTQRRLLDRKAQVDYVSAARKRLYDEVGPLRFEFLLAARDLESRVLGHPGERWKMDPAGYYASGFICRILHTFAVGELIERRVGIADFSVDPAAVGLLRALKAMERALSADEVVRDHPNVDWATETQHLFRQNLCLSSAALISGADGDGPASVMSFAEFRDACPDPRADPRLTALAAIFAACRSSLLENPTFWLRLVAYGYVCARVIRSDGVALGFDNRPYSVHDLLSGVDDSRIANQGDAYERAFDAILQRGL